MAFLPQICTALLGESLAIPGVATLWCGDSASRKIVLQRLDHLIIKPAYRRRGFEQVRTRQLAEMSRAELTELIQKDPGAFVAQERVIRSSVPVWSDTQFQQSFIALRALRLRTTTTTR